MQGFLPLNRELLDGDFLSSNEDLMIFIRLGAEAAFEPHPVRYRGQTIQLERGQFVYGRRALAARWGIAPSTLEDVLRRFTRRNLITRKSDRFHSIITVCQYELYFGSQESARPRSDQSPTTTRPESDTSEEGKKGKKVKKEEGERDSAAPAAAASKTTWLTPFGDIWKRSYGGAIGWGEAARAMKPLVDEHGSPAVEYAFERYCSQTEARFATTTRFSQTYGTWVNGHARSNGKMSSFDQAKLMYQVGTQLAQEAKEKADGKHGSSEGCPVAGSEHGAPELAQG
jgi:hypothetical protein